MKNCKKCNAQMEDNVKFCPVCGAPAPAAPPANPQPPQPRKMSAAPFIVICAVLILVMAGGAGFFVWKIKNGPKQETMAEGGDGWGSRDRRMKEEPQTAAAPATVAETAAAPETAAVAETAAAPVAAAETAAMTAVPQTAAPMEAPTEYTTMYAVNCNEFITLRDSPSTGARELARIPLGAAVSYAGTSTNGFYQVVYNGHTGYALASYLSTDKPFIQSAPVMGGAVYNTMYVVNCQENITLRTSDSTGAGEICKIPLGAAVSYVSTAGNGFYKIIYLGKTGYALASYLSY